MDASLIRHAQDLPFTVEHSLIGRNTSQQWVRDELSNGAPIWLYGSPGVGRRTLVSHIAQDYLQEEHTVLWMVPYHDDLSMMAERLLRMVGTPYTGGDLFEQARQGLQREALLLVVEGTTTLNVRAQFLQHCVSPGTPTIILNTAEAYEANDGLSLGPLSRTNAERLYREVAGIDDTRRSALLAPLLSYIEGHPFALFVAAKQQRDHGISSTHFASVLPETPAGAVPRSLGVIDVVYKLLDSASQGVLLLTSSLFAEVIHLPLLVTISGVETPRLRGILDNLVGRALLRRLPGQEDAYRVHELVRLYARKRLRASNQYPATLNRVLQGVLRHILQHSEPSSEHFDALARTSDHILGAMRYAAHIEDHHFAETVLRMLNLYGDEGFIVSRGYQAYYKRLRQIAGVEAEPTVQAALVSVPSPDDTQENLVVTAEDTQDAHTISAERLVKEFEQAKGKGDPVLVVRLATALGDWYSNQYDPRTAIHYYQQALQALDVDAARSAYLQLVLKLARAYVADEDGLAAMQWVGKGMQLLRRDPQTRGELLDASGDARQLLGDAGGALQDYQSAMEILEAQSALIPAGIAMTKAATIRLDHGENQEASLLLAQAADVFERGGRRDLQGQALGNLGTALGYMGRWREAGRRHMLALQIAREIGDKEEERYQLGNLAFVSETEGYMEWALHYHRQALYLSLVADDVEAVARHAFDIGRILMLTPSSLAQAIVMFEASLRYQVDAQTRSFLEAAQHQLSQYRNTGYPVYPAEDVLTFARTAYES